MKAVDLEEYNAKIKQMSIQQIMEEWNKVMGEFKEPQVEIEAEATQTIGGSTYARALYIASLLEQFACIKKDKQDTAVNVITKALIDIEIKNA